MAIKLKGKSGTEYEFEGPFKTTDSIDDRSGVYAIICPKADNSFGVLDIGESKEVKTRLDGHDRSDCWVKNCKGGHLYLVHYIEYGKKPSRTDIEQDLREARNLPCGDK